MLDSQLTPQQLETNFNLHYQEWSIPDFLEGMETFQDASELGKRTLELKALVMHNSDSSIQADLIGRIETAYRTYLHSFSQHEG